MTPARFDQTDGRHQAEDLVFRATGQVMKLRRLHPCLHEGRDEGARAEDEEERERALPELHEGDRCSCSTCCPSSTSRSRRRASRKRRSSRSSKRRGSGGRRRTPRSWPRSSTRSTSARIKQRRLRPSELGRSGHRPARDSFPDILNVEFTAGMEDELDDIEEGKQNWVDAMRRFYGPFKRISTTPQTDMRDVKARGPADGHHLREVRLADGHQMGPAAASSSPARAIPSARTPRTSRVDDDGNINVDEVETTEVLPRSAASDARSLRPLRQVSRLLRLSRMSPHTVRSPLLRRRLGITCPDCERGRRCMEQPLAPRQDLLQLRSLPGMQVRDLGSAGPRAVSDCGAVRRRERRPSAPARCVAASGGCGYKEQIEGEAVERLTALGAPAEMSARNSSAPGARSSAAGSPAARLPGSSRAAAFPCGSTRCVRCADRGPPDAIDLAELVCSNSFRSASLDTAVGS